jgi:membrane protein implicated in regulation of membrane protease activity
MLENTAPELLWFILGFLLLLAELAIPAFIVVFFGVGAWVTSLATLIGIAPNIEIQLVIFIVVSVLALVLFRKKGQRARGRIATKKHEAHEIDTLAGSLATVTEDIEPQSRTGRVELFGTSWQATADVAIKKGSAVEVVSKDNLVLRVKPRS